MLFNSFSYALFLPVLFVLYWFVFQRNLRFQNFLLLAASYFFYSCWDWRFVILLIFSTLLDYFTGIQIHEAATRKTKKLWLWISVGINLGLLGFFKYFNFFAESFARMLTEIGLQVNYSSLQIILPIGISFYTLHGLSYIFDLYKNKIEPERNFVNYAVFVSFFPLLVAGPIERATHLLPQIVKKRKFEFSQMADGLRQILWGLFKKIVIADNCAEYVNAIFNNSSSYNGSTLAIGILFFAFQVYCDFSGYSDIAIGTARLLGINLLRNFAFPYFSRDMAEFWRRWHISLTSWVKDYLYIPLGGSKGGLWIKIRNVFIIFIVSGFWHGANWTFILWGVVHAILILPSIIFNTNRENLDIVAKGKYLPSLKEFFSMAITFTLSVFAMIFFRAIDVPHAFSYINGIISASLFDSPNLRGISAAIPLVIIILIFMLIEWLGREQQYAISNLEFKLSKPVRWVFYYSIIVIIYIYAGKEQTFIYFRF